MDVRLPDGTILRNVPEGTTKAQIMAKLGQAPAAPVEAPKPNAAAMNPEVQTPLGTISGESSSGFNPAAMLIQSGSALEKLKQGVIQARVGPADWLKQKMGMQPSELGQRVDADVQESKKPMADLREVHPGSTMLGDVLPALAMPWRALPAVAASEYGSPTERAARGGMALAGTALAVGGSRAASGALEASKARAAQNAATNQSTAKFRDAGLAMPPSMTNPTLANRVVEGVSGGTKTEQAFSKRNQPIFDRLIKRDLGIPDGAPVTSKTLESIRAEAGKSYKAIQDVPKYVTDDAFAQEIQSLRPALSSEVPEMANPAIDNLIKGLSKPEFSGKTAVDLVKRLRYQAGANFEHRADPGRPELAQAQRAAADAIEDVIERNLTAMGDEAKLAAFRAAREKIAKTWAAESALNESGNFAAKELGKMLDKGKPLSGGMKTVAEFAERFPKSSQTIDAATKANPFSVVDALFSGGAAAATANPALLAGIFARPALRAGISSQPYQQLMGRASEKPRGMLGARALDNELSPFISGLLGYQAGR